MLPDFNNELNNIAQQWYDAAENNVDYNKKIELHQNTKHVIKTLKQLRDSGQTEKVVNLSQILIDKFNDHDIYELDILAKWVDSGSYKVLHKLFKLIADINNYPQAFTNTYDETAKTWIHDNSAQAWHLSSLIYVDEAALNHLKNDEDVTSKAKGQGVTSVTSKVEFQEDPAFINEQKIIFSDLDFKSLVQLGKTSPEYNQLAKIMIIDRMNKGEVTTKDLDLNSFEEVINYFGEKNCEKITNLDFRSGRDFHSLEKCDLSLESIGKNASLFPNLKKLSLEMKGTINETNAKNLTELKKLETFDLEDKAQNFNLVVLPKSLISLSLHSFSKYPTNLAQLKNCPELKIFSCSSARSLINIQDLKNCPQLEVLELDWCEGLTNIDVLKHCSSLKVLDLSNSKVSDFSVLEYLPSLRELKIFYAKSDTLTNFEFMQNCQSLTHLSIIGVIVKNEDNKFFNLPHLTSLDVTIGRVNDEFFQNFPELKVLECAHSTKSIDADFLKYLPDLKEFTSYPSIINLDVFEYCKNLTKMSLIYQTDMVDANFMSYLPNIQEVKFCNCFNLVDIGALENSDSLQLLNIQGCKRVPLAQVENLRSRGVKVLGVSEDLI